MKNYLIRHNYYNQINSRKRGIILTINRRHYSKSKIINFINLNSSTTILRQKIGHAAIILYKCSQKLTSIYGYPPIIMFRFEIILKVIGINSEQGLNN